MTATFDSKCYDLALLFLSDEPQLDCEVRRTQLALLIQEVIEDYLSQEHLLEASLDPRFDAVLEPLAKASAEPQDGR